MCVFFGGITQSPVDGASVWTFVHLRRTIRQLPQELC